MSTSGLGRGLGSLLEPKDAASTKRPTSRGLGVLIGEGQAKAPEMPAAGIGDTNNLVSSGLEKSGAGMAAAAARTSSEGRESGTAKGVRWMWRSLITADLVLVGVSAWILMEPAVRTQRGATFVGCLLMSVAGILGLVGSRLAR